MNNREISISVWVFILFSLAMFKKEFRNSIFSLVKAFTAIIKFYFIMTLYVLASVLVLYHFNLWNVSLIKETIFWYFGNAFVSITYVDKINKEDDYFKKLMFKYLKLVTILEFVISAYSFSLSVELILVPIIIFASAMSAVASIKKEYYKVEKLFNGLLSSIGLAITLYALSQIFIHFNKFASIDNLTKFYIPPILTVLFSPFIYFFALYLSYEVLFLRLKYFIKNKKIIKYAKWRIAITFHIKLRELNRFAKEYAFLVEENGNENEYDKDDDIDMKIKIFKRNKGTTNLNPF